jgi:hypothetical protein
VRLSLSNTGSLLPLGQYTSPCGLYWTEVQGRPYIAAAGNVVYKQAVKVGLVQAWDEPSQGGSYGMLPGPGGARAEAERRR